MVLGKVSFSLGCGLGKATPGTTTESSSPGGKGAAICVCLAISHWLGATGGGLGHVPSPAAFSLGNSQEKWAAGAGSWGCVHRVSVLAREGPGWALSAFTRACVHSAGTHVHGGTQVPMGHRQAQSGHI